MILSANKLRQIDRDIKEDMPFLMTDTATVIMECFDAVNKEWVNDSSSYEFMFINAIKEYEVTELNYDIIHKVIYIIYNEIQAYLASNDENKKFLFFTELDEYLTTNEKDFTIETIAEFIDDISSYSVEYKRLLLIAAMAYIYDPIFSLYDILDDENKIVTFSYTYKKDVLNIPEYYLIKANINYLGGAYHGFKYAHDAHNDYRNRINNIRGKNIENIKLFEETLKKSNLTVLKKLYEILMIYTSTAPSNDRHNYQPLLLYNNFSKHNFTSDVNADSLMCDIVTGRYKNVLYHDIDNSLIGITREIVEFIEDVLLIDVYAIYKDAIDNETETKGDLLKSAVIKYIDYILYSIPASHYRTKISDADYNEYITSFEGIQYDVSKDYLKSYMLFSMAKQYGSSKTITDDLGTSIKTFIYCCDSFDELVKKIISDLLSDERYERVVESK